MISIKVQCLQAHHGQELRVRHDAHFIVLFYYVCIAFMNTGVSKLKQVLQKQAGKMRSDLNMDH